MSDGLPRPRMISAIPCTYVRVGASEMAMVNDIVEKTSVAGIPQNTQKNLVKEAFQLLAKHYRSVLTPIQEEPTSSIAVATADGTFLVKDKTPLDVQDANLGNNQSLGAHPGSSSASLGYLPMPAKAVSRL